MNLDEIYALIDANKEKAEKEYLDERCSLKVHKAFTVEDREIEPMLLARPQTKAQYESLSFVNAEIWAWYDDLFVYRPDTTTNVNMAYSVLKPSARRENLSQKSKSKFAMFDRNIVNEIIKHCGIQTVSRLSIVNKWLNKLCMKEEVWEELFSRLCTLKDICERESSCPIKFKPLLNEQMYLENLEQRVKALTDNTAEKTPPLVVLRYYQDTKSLLKRMQIIPGVNQKTFTRKDFLIFLQVQGYDAHSMNYAFL